MKGFPFENILIRPQASAQTGIRAEGDQLIPYTFSQKVAYSMCHPVIASVTEVGRTRAIWSCPGMWAHRYGDYTSLSAPRRA